MISRLEIAKDSAEQAVTSGVGRVGNIHGLIAGYAKQWFRRGGERTTIYGVVEGVTREVGGLGTDLFEIAEAARRAERDRRRDDTVDDA
ncbi:hypothetical protein PC39_04322 [Salinisphaera sp. PC39]|uniref:hypothetical protein n=1 Tax=Salinisphaera sp. PC39 TaxID=1304156 RepID=UPI00333E8915